MKKAFNAVHGAGDAIRGSINVMADRATGDHYAGSKNEATVRHGVDQMNPGQSTTTGAAHVNEPIGHQGGVHSGVDPGKPNLVEQGEHPHRGGHGLSGQPGVGNNPGSTNYGPHSSNTANKLDPSVDSDLDHRGGSVGQMGHSGNAGYGNAAHMNAGRMSEGHAGVGQSQYGQPGVGNTATSGNYGPHSSNMANKADPRVDSDLDGRGAPTAHTGHGNVNYGANEYGNSTHMGGNHAGPGHMPHGQHGVANNNTSNNYGPHSSNLANKADPRVDSDLDGRGVPNSHGGHGNASYAGNEYGNSGHMNSGYTGAGQMHSGQPGVGNTARSENYGPHSSNLANKADPRVDSDLDGRGAPGSYNNPGHTNTTDYGNQYNNPGHGNAGYTGAGQQPGYGHNNDNVASSNYGPHSSNIANKADPRVDSDLDGRDAPRHHNQHHQHGGMNSY